MITDEDLLIRRDPASWLMTASLVSYVIAFFLPAYGNSEHQYVVGAQAFVVSFVALSDGNPFWLANLSYWIAIVLSFRGTNDPRPLVFFLLALLLAIAVVCVLDVRPDFGGEALLAGYYTWILSFGFGVASASIMLRRYQSSSHASSAS